MHNDPLCIRSERGFLCYFFNSFSAYASVLDIVFIRRHKLAKRYILNYKRNPSVTFWGNSGKIIKK